jgi:hypothetical protein
VWKRELTVTIFFIYSICVLASLIGWRPGQLLGWPTPYSGPAHTLRYFRTDLTVYICIRKILGDVRNTVQRNLKTGIYTVHFHINISPYFIETLCLYGILFSLSM